MPTYFSPISQYSALWNQDEILFEIHDNYQKQSYRNRCYICGPNGKQLLTIPITFDSSQERKKTRDAKIDYSESWQKQHLKSFESGYNSSPFFELLQPDLEELYNKKHTFLLDLNIDSFLFVKSVLELPVAYAETHNYSDQYREDFRFLADAKTTYSFEQKEYYQVFSERYNFMKNLSILDLIFMEGANAISFLEKNHVTLVNPL